MAASLYGLGTSTRHCAGPGSGPKQRTGPAAGRGLASGPAAAGYWISEKYDIAADKVDAGYPKPIAGNWPGFWPGGLDA